MSILPLCASARLRLHSSNVNSNLPFVARIGEAGQQILEYAKDLDIDLVIVGRQGAGKVGKILFGNVTERVVRKAPCPVLVIPPSPK